jgi:hypothetical protein
VVRSVTPSAILALMGTLRCPSMIRRAVRHLSGPPW